ncbi:MAG: putative Ig domain-containing protein, partial [Acidobacteriota bacterium]
SGQIVVGGSFSLLGGQARNNIGRMNLDGSLDASFLPGANGSVYTLAVQADNQIVMGGNFTVVAGQAHSHIARVNNNGLIDGSFNADASGYLNAIAFQSDGRILIGGVFTTVNNLTSNRIARLNTDGTLDTSFNPNANDIVSALAIQADGKVLVGGIFTAIGGQSRNRIARLNTDGSLDAGFFNLNANGDVDAILVKPDGTIVIGGNFSAPGNRLALINRDGSIGNPIAGADGFVAALATQPDGKVVAVGNFTTLGGSISRNHIGRFNLDNTVDRDFTVGANDFPAALAMQPDGKMLVGGLFTTLGGLPIPRLARLNLDGSFDVNFAPAPNGNVYVLAVQPDGKILAGGFFTTIGGQQRNFIARLNADGTVDGSFVAQCDGVVRDIVVQPDGKILIGGDFLTANGQLHNRVARLNANGTLDNNFNNFGASHSVYAIALQADGKIVIGGSFDFVNAQPRTAIARLNADGTLDAGFNPGAGFAVFALAIQTDGKILVGGDFSILGGQSRANFGRLNADGSLDTGFSPNVGSSGVSLVETIALQTDRKIIIGGSFETLGGQTRNNIGRVNANGTLDTGFNPGADSTVFSLLIQPDGKVMVGGSFTTLGGQPRQGLGRLTNTDAAPQLLSLTNANTGIYWGRTNAGPEVRRVSFETSTDGVNFSFVGAGTYSVLGAWTLTGLSLPTNQNFYVRARGFYGGGWRGNSGSIVESVRQSYIAAVVPCTFSLNPTSQNIGAAGGSSNTALTASAANCAWTVQSNAAWLTPSIFSGNGSASIGYVVAPNVGAQRTGTMTIAGQTLTVTQAAFACPVITVNPASLPVGIQGAAYNQSLTASGGTAPYTFSLTGSFPTGIGMTASGAIIGTPGVSGTFNLTIFVTDANGCTGSRSYTLTVNSVGGGNAGLQFYPLSRPVRILDTRAGQGNCDNISAPINGGTSLTTFARLTCEGISIPANAQAVVGNLTIINQTAQIGYLTIYPDGQAAPLAANMIYAPGDILANNFTVGLGANGNFNIFGERTIDAIVDISGYYAPPAAGGLYYHPLAKPIRLMDTRPGQGNCDNVGAPINAGGSLTTLARKTCEGLTIPAAAQAIVGNATVINVSGQVGYLTIYPN